MVIYKHAIILHKLYHTHQPQADRIEINFNKVFTSRLTHFRIIKNNNCNVGNNLLSTHLAILNGKVLVEDLNLSFDSFKVKYKKLMLWISHSILSS